MVRLRNAVMVLVLATGPGGVLVLPTSGRLPTGRSGTATRAMTFPTPAYGPNYSMMPGTYTGPPTPGIERLQASLLPAAPPLRVRPPGMSGTGDPRAESLRADACRQRRTTPPTPPNP